MNQPAQTTVRIRKSGGLLFTKNGLFVLSLLAAALSMPSVALAAAGGIQICAPSSTCEVGEFLFNDDYTALTGATCTMTSKYPDGSAHLTSQAMTGQADGWYSYSFTSPSTTGLYRTTVCCTAGSDYLCIDKGFEVKADTGSSAPSADEVASAVWGYSNRTLSSFGTLVRDIWLNSTRSLTTLNLDSDTTIASESDLSEIEKTVKENRLLLEELVNKPIIETFIDEDEQDLSSKLDETRTVSNGLYANSEYVRSKSLSIVSKWNSLTDKELIASIDDIYKVIGGMDDKKNNTTITGSINWLSKSWGWDVTNELGLQVEQISKAIDGVKIDISTRGRSVSAYTNIKNLSANLDKIQNLVGDSTETEPNQTLFGKLREVTLIAQSLDKKNEELQEILIAWDTTSESETRSNLNSVSQSVSLLNRITQLNGYLALSNSTTTGKDLKNKAFAVGGVIEANRKVLARSSDSAIAATWLELGSIVFKSVIINPSSLISQDAELKYYLPPEVTDKDIKRIDDGLSVTYDVERNQYFVEGKFNLDPKETITVSVSVEDIWVITDEELNTIVKQVEDLTGPLEGTAFFAQGVTLKSDIEVSLEKISMLQSKAVTPEQKIRAYREASILLADVYEKIGKLKDLLTGVSSNATMQAFVGGAQVFGVWGIIIVVVAGVTFLAIYMKHLHAGKNVKKHKTPKNDKDDKQIDPTYVFGDSGFPYQINWNNLRQSALVLLVFGTIVSAGTTAVVLNVSKAPAKEQTLQQAQVQVQETSKEQVLSEQSEVEPEAVGGEDLVRIEVSEGSSVNVRESSSTSSNVILSLRFSLEATKLESTEDFTKVVVRLGERGEDMLEGWVHNDFVMISYNEQLISEGDAEIVDNSSQKQTESESDQTISSNLEVEILETSTGWLRVRKAPRGEEISKVNSGETFKYLNETETWYQISLPDGTKGWVSKEFSRVK